jgi:hypothetical protein
MTQAWVGCCSWCRQEAVQKCMAPAERKVSVDGTRPRQSHSSVDLFFFPPSLLRCLHFNATTHWPTAIGRAPAKHFVLAAAAVEEQSFCACACTLYMSASLTQNGCGFDGSLLGWNLLDRAWASQIRACVSTDVAPKYPTRTSQVPRLLVVFPPKQGSHPKLHHPPREGVSLPPSFTKGWLGGLGGSWRVLGPRSWTWPPFTLWPWHPLRGEGTGVRSYVTRGALQIARSMTFRFRGWPCHVMLAARAQLRPGRWPEVPPCRPRYG